MRNYIIKTECKLPNNPCTKILNYCSFTLSTERANSLIPLGLHNIEICEQPIYIIDSKIFDAPVSISEESQGAVFRLKHHLGIKQEIDEWLSSIDATNIKYFDKITLPSNDIQMGMRDVYIHAIGEFDIEHVSKSPL